MRLYKMYSWILMLMYSYVIESKIYIFDSVEFDGYVSNNNILIVTRVLFFDTWHNNKFSLNDSSCQVLESHLTAGRIKFNSW